MDIESGTAVLALAILLGGCTGEGLNSASTDQFGEASRQTFAAQIIDPDPVYDNPVPTGTGTQAQQAIERVRRDTVKKPEKVRTSSVGTASGSN